MTPEMLAAHHAAVLSSLHVEMLAHGNCSAIEAGQLADIMLDELKFDGLSEGLNYLGHNYLGHNYIGHNLCSRTFIGHTYCV